MNGIALKNFRERLKMSIYELANAIPIQVRWINYIEAGLDVDPYFAKKIDQFFFGTVNSLILTKTINPNEIYLEQPRSPNYNFCYPIEMMLNPINEDVCVKLTDAKNQTERTGDIAIHVVRRNIKNVSLKNTLFRYSETTPSVGDTNGT